MNEEFCRAAVACAVALLAGVAQAQEAKSPWEKASIQLGVLDTHSDTEMRIDSETLGVGAVVNVEDALGVDSNKRTYRIDALYRPGSTRRHQWDVAYFDSRRSGDKVLEEEIQVGDTVFPLGAAVSSEFNLRFLNVNYSYAFFQDERVRLSAAVGLHVTGVELKMKSPGLALFEDESFTAPLPVVGMRGEVLLTQSWRLKGSMDVFYLRYDNVEGALVDSLVAVEYLPFKNVGFGLGVNTVRLTARADGNNSARVDLNGEVTFTLGGAMLYVKGYF